MTLPSIVPPSTSVTSAAVTLSAATGVADTKSLAACAPPLDYSFKELRTCSELETEEPRGGGRRRLPENKDGVATVTPQNAADASPGGAVEVAGAATAAGIPVPLAQAGVAASAANIGGVVATPRATSSSSNKRVIRKVTVAVKLNNNVIESLQDLPHWLGFVMDDPMRNLQWVDVSHNHILRIEESLLQLKNMKALYMHANRIKSLPSVNRLKTLPKLISLTLNGNPIDAAPSYRVFVVATLRTLRKLDHTTVTEEELKMANAWYQAHLKRLKTRREKAQEAYLDSLED
eukprot:TRINITY_DN54690_c0_g1_i1.p1 TRINITY_DN54690_c0_g1~~TRINITY_DN54690_c0_g1_i1.p1  ORF type:complete len:290 (+),score=57.80 TRINITY_DN54690_c0_g1_i1:77-946(+)